MAQMLVMHKTASEDRFPRLMLPVLRIHPNVADEHVNGTVIEQESCPDGWPVNMKTLSRAITTPWTWLRSEQRSWTWAASTLSSRSRCVFC